MVRLNSIGAKFALLKSVHAMTDVTGFGLLGHLLEMCRVGEVSAEIDFAAIPQLADLVSYHIEGMAPGGTRRNLASYGDAIDCPDALRRDILSDPQTSGGLLVAIDPDARAEFEQVFRSHGLAIEPHPLGTIRPRDGDVSRILVR